MQLRLELADRLKSLFALSTPVQILYFVTRALFS